MMRGAGAAAVLVAALVVCCSADSHQEQETNAEHNSPERFDASGSKGPAELRGRRLARDVREARRPAPLPYLMPRRYTAFGGRHEPWLAADGGYYSLHKRNFDEIDRSDLDPFVGVGKRNFDEIDHTSLPFPYAAKRFYLYGGNYLDAPIEAWRSGFDKKRLMGPEYPMDEIDLSHFPIGSKRSLDYNLDFQRANLKRGGDYPMDEIDLSHFPIGSRRSLPLHR